MHQFLSLLFGKLRTKAVLSLVCLTTLLAGNALATDWYVALPPTGNNNNNGQSASSPFATIQKAADNAISGDVVYVREGVYREQVDIKVSGVTFRPYNGETVTINGTDLLGGWTQVGSSSTWKTTAMNWDLLPASFGNRGYGENQLFQDTTMIDLLRWPKNVSTDIAMPTMAIVESVTFNKSAGTTTIIDSKFTGGNEWVGAQVFVNLAHDGYDGQGWVGKVTAVGTNSITVDFYRDEDNKVWSIGARTEYYLFNPASGKITDSNVDGLLGQGEWYKNGSTLYVKTRNGSQPNGNASQNIYAKRRYFAFAGDGTASNYTVDGFNLFGCSVTTYKDHDLERLGAARSCSGVKFKNLNIKYISHQIYTNNYQIEHTAWSGLVLNGSDHIADNCTITYSATSAISLHGYRHKAINNKIYNTNYMCSNAGAINTGRFNNGSNTSYDLEIGNNVISNTTHVGIYISNLQNSDPTKKGVARVHHNTIVNYMRRSGDSGAIDESSQDLQWVRIDHNYIYNTLGHDEGKNGAQIFGIYLDFGANDQLIRAIIDHNVITNCTTPIVINDGTDVEMYNNVLIGNGITEFAEINGKHSIGNYNDENGNRGKNIRIFNNILSHPYTSEYFANALYSANIEGATVGSQLVTDLFVSPKFTGTGRSVNDFKLKDNSVTQAKAIDKGILLGDYSNEGLATGKIPDIGAFEFGGTITDVTAPSAPETVTVSNASERGFTLTWTAPADNSGGSGVAYYELSSTASNLIYKRNIGETTIDIKNLTASTTYNFRLYAYDRAGNRSVAKDFTAATATKVAEVLIPKTTASTVPLDGIRESSVYALSAVQMIKLADGTASTIAASDFSANWTATWDNNNLYVHVAVTDDIRKSASADWYNNDNVEIFLNGDGNRPDKYGTYDFQFYISPGGTLGLYKDGQRKTAPTGVEAKTSDVNTTSYTVELKVPFSVLGITSPADLPFIGLDVNAGDDDGETSKPKLIWKSEAYKTPSTFGLVKLSTATTTLRDADNPASTSAGLDYKYYEGNWSVLPNFDVLTAAKQGNVTNFDLTPRNRDDNFGFKFSGYVNVPSDGTYTFYTSSDDGSKLYIGSTEVVSNDFLQDGSVERSGSIGLKAGKHAITVVFFEAGGGQLLTVSYSSSSIAKTTIPASALYRAATSTTATDRTDPVGTGTVTARGQNGTGEGKDKAFDNSKDTKWLDFSATSWIQFQFAGTAKYAVSKYTITSANDEQGRDPRDWKLYGTNVANPSSSELFEVDSQFNVTFDNRYQKKEFTVSSSNTTPYRAYRLVITANKSAGAISIIQLSEIELFAPDCSGCRISAEAESIQQRESLTLQVHPNPTTSEVTISLAGFEEESVVQLQMRDMSGKSFLRRQVQPSVEGKQVSLSVGHLPQGLFFVTVQGSKVAKTAKLIITR